MGSNENGAWTAEQIGELAKYVTKRELAAMLAMQADIAEGGMCANGYESKRAPTWVAHADALLAELAKGGEG